jgi:hypothetical protein
MEEVSVSSEPEVVEGHFWLPGEEGHRFYGRLEYDIEHGVQAHFVDTNLIQHAPDGPVQPGAIDVLHGEALGGTPLTLQGFYPAKWRLTGMRPSGDDVIDGVVRRLLRGAHIPVDEEPRAAIAGTSLKGLREFLIGGIVDGGPLQVPVEDLRGENLNVELAGGVSLLLNVHRQPTMGRVDRHSEVVASAQWSCDPPISLDDLEEHWIGPLKNLILFATRAQSYVLALGLHPDPSDPGSSIRVLQRPYPPPREVPEVYALALNLRESGDPGRLIRSWFDLHDRVGPVWGLFFAALDRPESLLEDRLLGLLAFADG